MEPNNLITIPEAAELKGVCRQSIYNAVRAGKIKVTLEVRGKKLLNRADVEKYKPRQKRLEANRQRKERGEGAQG